jgi:hypothetical protein
MDRAAAAGRVAPVEGGGIVRAPPASTTREQLLRRLLSGAGRAAMDRAPTTRDRLADDLARGRPATSASAAAAPAAPSVRKTIDLVPAAAIAAAIAAPDGRPAVDETAADAAALVWLDRNGRFLVSIATSMENLLTNVRRNQPDSARFADERLEALVRGWARSRGVPLPAPPPSTLPDQLVAMAPPGSDPSPAEARTPGATFMATVTVPF